MKLILIFLISFHLFSGVKPDAVNCEKLNDAYLYYNDLENALPITVKKKTAKIIEALCKEYSRDLCFEMTRYKNLKDGVYGFEQLRSLYRSLRSDIVSQPRLESSFEKLGTNYNEFIQTLNTLGTNIRSTPGYTDLQTAKYQIIELLRQGNTCSIRTLKTDLNNIKTNQSVEQCFSNTELLGDHTFFVLDNLDIVLNLNKNLYNEQASINRFERVKIIQEKMCSNIGQKLVESISISNEQRKQKIEGKRHFCSLIDSKRKARLNVERDLDQKLGRELTFGDYWLGRNGYRGMPGLAMALQGGLGTVFNYITTNEQIKYYNYLDTQATNYWIYNEKFRITNCIGQQSLGTLNWNFSSLDNTPVLPDLSNMDWMAGGNFANCNPDTFISPTNPNNAFWYTPQFPSFNLLPPLGNTAQ